MMLWNWIKSVFWCGVLHEPKVCMDTGYPDVPPTEKDKGQTCVCAICGTTYEVL